LETLENAWGRLKTLKDAKSLSGLKRLKTQ